MFGYENTTAKQASGSEAVKLAPRSLFNLIAVVVYVLRITLSRFTNFVFPLLEWLFVLVITKVLVISHKIHVKNNPSKP